MKIAPMLHRMTTGPGFKSSIWSPARSELRALIAVARAATKERAAVLEVARYARGTHKGEIDGDYIGRMLEDSDERLACALGRLERVSGRKP